jgi:hypothetical protein
LRKQDALVLTLAAAIVVTCVVYALAPSGPVYHPVEHLWRWDAISGTPSMKWYGRSLWALLAGGGAALVVALGSRRFVRDDAKLPSKAPTWVSVITLVVLVGTLVDTVVHEVSTWMR